MVKPSLTHEQIGDLLDTVESSNVLYKEIELVWLAMTDWPTSIEDTNELLIELNKELQGGLTKNNLITYSDYLCKNLGVIGNGWKVEATTSLIELFTFYPDVKTLESVFSLFNEVVRNKLIIGNQL